MGMKAARIFLALSVGCAIAAATSILQPHFKAGSAADLVCDFIFLPGGLFATLFHDRGNASPEFLWRSRLMTVALFSGLTYWILSRKRPTEQSDRK
jgi:hypothetical protein